MSIEQFKLHKENGFLRLTAGVLLAAMLIVCMLPQSVAAENRYRITDGDRTYTVTTDATDPDEVLDEAGLELGVDDTYTTQETDGVSEIHVQRVHMVTIDNGGQILKTGSRGETVAQVLTRLNVTYTEDDEISVSLDEETYEGMEIVISRKTYATEVYSKTIPYETEYCEDPSLPTGQEQVLTIGSDGEMLCTAEVTYENGQEASRTLISSEMTVLPVNELIAVGTAPAEEDATGELTIGNGVIVTESGDELTYTSAMTVLATAYTCEGWGRQGITATGTVARVGAIAVDPTVIPYGTRMFIVSNDGQYIYGIATAEDTGHLDYITGNRIDLYYNTEAECVQFGARYCTVYILG